MGYLVAGHLLRQAAPFDRLEGLPEGVAYRVHAHHEPDFWGIETFGKKFKKDWPPYTQSILDTKLSRSVDRSMPAYAAVVRAIEDADGKAVPEVHGVLDLGLTISSLLGTKLLTYLADDDTLDFACVCEDGRLVRLQGTYDQYKIVVSRSRVSLRPLRDPEDPDAFNGLGEDFLAVVRGIKGVSLGRPINVDSRLHGNVLDECRDFLRWPKPVLSIGSFDLEERPADELVTERLSKSRK